jgi:hypothetical protein
LHEAGLNQPQKQAWIKQFRLFQSESTVGAEFCGVVSSDNHQNERRTMPTQTNWVDPELLLDHGGVKVFHTYKNDDLDQGPNPFWFTLNSESGWLIDSSDP